MVTEDKSIGFPDDEPNVISEESSFVEEAPAVAGGRTPWYRKRWPLLGIALAVAATIAALALTNGRTDQSTAGEQAAPPGLTVKQYIQESGIISTQVRRGDPGAPLIGLGLPPGWSGFGYIPPEAYGGLKFDNAPDPNDPPTILVDLDKFTGNVDPEKIFDYSLNELTALPDFAPLAEPDPTPLNGFEAVQLAGRYNRDGQSRIIGQKTVVIPSDDALFVLRITAEGLETDSAVLMEATRVIDARTVITP